MKIETKFNIGQEVYYIAPKKKIKKAKIVAFGDAYLILQSSNRMYLKIDNVNIFETLLEAKNALNNIYANIPKNYKRNKLNNVYWKMRDRCCNPKNASYHNYGGKGITICEDWLHSYNNFKEWAIKNGYTEEMLQNGRNKWTLDRIDNNKGYSPDNCRWVTMKDQQNNRTNNKEAKLKEIVSLQ